MTRSFPFATLATLILLVAAATPATGGAGTGVLPCDPNDAAPQVPILGTRVSPRIVGPGRVVASQHLVEATYECGQASVAGAGLAGQSDSDGDGMGDRWVGQWEAWTGQVLKAADDADQDGLRNSDEFRWELVPICFAIPARILQNCQDSEGDRSTGANGDGWRDGAEVSYWNDASNDFLRAEAGLALYDPDRLLDTDNDGRSNVNDTDSDNDGLRDGAEALAYDTYPELVDSDCAVLATACTPSSQTTYHGARSGSPGVGDGLNDSAELAFWEAMQPGSWAWDHDGDGIANALLDPDSDGDGLLDGEEFLLGRGQVRPDRADTDGDGVSDFNETAWSQDTDGDGLVNAADTDADGDGMPDGWEAHYGLNMVDPTDAGLDKDRDGLANLGEYQHATFPDNPDSEGDELQDGPEVAEGTNPFSHDSDSDGLPDAWEAKFKLHGGSIAANPVQADAGVDGDGDSFTAPWCGNAGHAFSNRAEYLHGIPDGWDSRPTQAGGDGVYWGGAQPNAVDTDGDGLADGYEVCSGLEPTTVDVLAGDDADADGLSNAAEGPAGTRYDAPDTDGDGLCDGGRAASCTSGNGDLAPGEANDYHTDGLRADTDGEGWLDGAEAAYWDPTGAGTVPDSDRDGRDNLHEADSDGDGISDLAEHESGTGADPSRADTDADGLTDKQELDGWQLSTWEPVTSDPRLADEDMDGLTDAQERDHQTDPRQADRDGDGLSDLVEVTGWGIVVNGVARNVTSNPNRQDTDWDLFSPEGGVLHDGQEFSLGTDPRVRDTDADGIVDGAEDQDRDGQAEEGEPSPVDNDTDDDGLLDGQEWNARMGDLHSDPLDADSDEDGVSDFAEVRTYGTDPLSHDTDNDFLPDGEEVGLAQAGGSPDKLTDPLDADTDDDGLPDGREAIFYGTDPRVADTDCDGQKDGSDPDPYNANVPPGEARPAAERACASAPTGNFGLRPADLPAPPVLASASAGAPADGDVGLLVFDQDGTVTLLARAPESETPITMVQAVIWLNGQLRTGADGTLSAGSGRITAELQTIDEPGAAPPSGSPYTHAVRVALPEGMVEAVSATYALTFVDANLNSATYTGGVDGFQLEEVGYADELNAADQQDYDDPSNSTLDGSGWSYVHANLTGQPRTDGPPGAQLAMGGGNVSDGLWIYRIVQPSVATLAGAIMDGKLVLVDASTVQVPVKAVLYTNTSVPVPKGDFGLYTQSSWWNSVAKAVKKVTQVASRVWGTVVTTATQAFNRAGQAVLGTTLAIYDEMRNPRSPAAYAARVAIDIVGIGDVVDIVDGVQRGDWVQVGIGAACLAMTVLPMLKGPVAGAKIALRSAEAAGASAGLLGKLGNGLQTLVKGDGVLAAFKVDRLNNAVHLATTGGKAKKPLFKGLEALVDESGIDSIAMHELAEVGVKADFLTKQAIKNGEEAAVATARTFGGAVEQAAHIDAKMGKYAAENAGTMLDKLELLKKEGVNGVNGVMASAEKMAYPQAKGHIFTLEKVAEKLKGTPTTPGLSASNINMGFFDDVFIPGVGWKNIRPDAVYLKDIGGGVLKETFTEYKNYDGILKLTSTNKLQLQKYGALKSAHPGSKVEYFVKNGQVSQGFKDEAKKYGIELFDGNGVNIPNP